MSLSQVKKVYNCLKDWCWTLPTLYVSASGNRGKFQHVGVVISQIRFDNYPDKSFSSAEKVKVFKGEAKGKKKCVFVDDGLRIALGASLETGQAR